VSLGAAAGAILGGPAADRFGRKTLLITDAGIYSSGGDLVSSDPRRRGADHDRPGLLHRAFAVGVGGTGWTLQGEVFPTAVRGQAASFAATVDWLANFALIEVFPVWQNAISLGGVMVCFAALCVLAIAFVYRFLPETKGLPVEEIVRVFERQRGAVAPLPGRPVARR